MDRNIKTLLLYEGHGTENRSTDSVTFKRVISKER